MSCIHSRYQCCPEATLSFSKHFHIPSLTKLPPSASEGRSKPQHLPEKLTKLTKPSCKTYKTYKTYKTSTFSRVARELLKAGANPNTFLHSSGLTPLHSACFRVKFYFQLLIRKFGHFHVLFVRPNAVMEHLIIIVL